MGYIKNIFSNSAPKDEVWYEEILASEKQYQLSQPSSHGPGKRAMLGWDGSQSEKPRIIGPVEIHLRNYKPKLIEKIKDETKEGSVFCLVRFLAEFWIERKYYDSGFRFTYAKYISDLKPLAESNPHPLAYDIFPRKSEHILAIDFTAKLGFSVGILSGEATKDFRSDNAQENITGYLGDNGTAPFWEICAKRESLKGLYEFFLAIEAPAECSGLKISTAALGKVENSLFGVIPLETPKKLASSKETIEIILSD